jgi:hypothetical protein
MLAHCAVGQGAMITINCSSAIVSGSRASPSTPSSSQSRDDLRRSQWVASHIAAPLLCRRITPRPAVTTASRRQVLEASAAMAAAAAGPAGGQNAGEALAAQSSGPDQQQGRPPETPCDLTRMRAYW